MRLFETLDISFTKSFKNFLKNKRQNFLTLDCSFYWERSSTETTKFSGVFNIKSEFRL